MSRARRKRNLRSFLREHWRELLTSLLASVRSRRHPVPGRAFEAFGRAVGWKATSRGAGFGPGLLLTPVNITRYWEFPFVWRHLPKPPGSCLDVGSPRLFALFVADRFPSSPITIVNPDRRDAKTTEDAARVLEALGIRVDVQPIEALDPVVRFHTIWSISVVEHIPNDGDVRAMAVMYHALQPGGRLLVTVPVDQVAWLEHRPTDTYGLGLPPGPEGYFFQRWYDEASLRDRLLEPIGAGSAVLEWFGERTPGRFAGYVERWLRIGARATLADGLEIGRHYREYTTSADMPGQGVCGIAITKPAEVGS